MSALATVIKQGRRGTESFDRGKLYESVYAACLSVQSVDGLARDTTECVCNILTDWLENKLEITSSDIRRQVAKALEPLHPDAAYLYKHHKQMI
ncbi:MAG TPA: ATP cone domain-containing protein [Candidatus Saccharimonadales bacterium]|nr:ATP cone domain-containing protein [Candidatus Saccharimonadales bacterium]